MNKPTALVGRHPPALRSGLRFFAPVGISPFARYCILNRSHDSIILRRLSTVTGRFHQSALRSGLRFFSACQIKDLSVRCRSQRRLSTVTGRFHQSALHSGLRFLLAHSLKDRILRSFLLLWVFRHLLAIAYAVARMAQLSYVAYRQLRADFINLPFTPALRFFYLSQSSMTYPF